jgi:hypothetical protein
MTNVKGKKAKGLQMSMLKIPEIQPEMQNLHADNALMVYYFNCRQQTLLPI